MSSSACFSRSASIETSPVGDRVVLYDTRSRKAIVLNPTGTWLWKTLSTPQSSEELSRQLQARFPSVASEQIQQDVETCLQQLMEQELLLKDAQQSG